MSRWALISGNKGDHKPEIVSAIAGRLSSMGVAVGGFVQLARYDARGEKGYELVRLRTGEKLTLALGGVAAKKVSEEAFCSYAFDNDAFARARRWIEEDAAHCRLLVLDDISKLEVQGKGHAPSLSYALSRPADRVVLISARASQLFYVVENFGLEGDPVDALELPVDEEAKERFVSALARACLR
jgi:nucleoside-triphosphatase THEP1